MGKKVVRALRGMVVLDFETDGLHPHFGHRPFLAGAEDENGTVIIADLNDRSHRSKLKRIRRAVEDPDVIKIAHNAKFEIRHARAMGWKVAGTWYCTMNMAVLIDEYQRLGLKELSLKWNQCAYGESDEIRRWCAAETKGRRSGWLKSFQVGLKEKYNVTRLTDIPNYRDILKEEVLFDDDCPPEVTFKDFYESSRRNRQTMLRYLEMDLDNTWKLALRWLPMIEETWAKPFKIDTDLVPYVAQMEDVGLPVDVGFCAEKIAEYTPLRAKLERRMHRLVGKKFNPQSPTQLLTILRDMGINVKDTRRRTLFNLQKDHRICELLLEFRTLTKMIRYFNYFVRAARSKEGICRIHASFWQNGEDEGIKTGRFSIKDPPLQTLPGGYRHLWFSEVEKGIEVRRSIVPSSPDRCILSLDFGQVEPRILAHYTGQPTLLKTIRAGEDIYIAFIRIFFGKHAPERASAKELKGIRSEAKTIILAITYGMGAEAMSAAMDGVDPRRAREMKNQSLRAMPEMLTLMNDTRRDIASRGYVVCLFGRWYRVPRDRSYKAINAIIQGAAALVMKKAITACGRELERWNRGRPERDHVHMLLTLHDELVFDCPKKHRRAVALRMRAAMESCAPEVSVPLVVDIEASDESWGDKKPYQPRHVSHARAA